MDDLTRKYVERLNESLAPQRNQPEPDLSSRQYKAFKQQYLPKRLSRYERACNWCAGVLSVAPDKKERPRLEEAIRICHLETTPEGTQSFAIVMPILFALAVAMLAYIIPVGIAAAMGVDGPGDYGSVFLAIFGLGAGLAMIVPLQRLPYFLANSWRMKASNQMVLCVFYVVTYMRHTSNLELAIDFAADHLAPPLSLDMKKVIWDIETEKYNSVKESLDAYLETWKDHSPEFIESMHLVEGSLVESSETRRVELLDKSLSVMLDETYEKMLHYAHNLKSPMTTLHMLGIILPILGLVILPLMVSFMPEVKWYHMAIVYNITLPVLVFILAKQILSTRPTGYGNADITDLNPELKKHKSIRIPLGGKDELLLSPVMAGVLILGVLLVIGIYPIAHHFVYPGTDVIMDQDLGIRSVSTDSEEYGAARAHFLDYREIRPKEGPAYILGPYGIGAVLLSLCLPLALGFGIGVIFSIRSRDVIKIRERTRKLEQEFASALFQLGNRLADGLPAEIAFSKVSDVLQGSSTGRFFDTVTTNIAKLGMSVEEAIFDPHRGALLDYPSNIIESSMKVLVESSKKGPLIASQAIINVSEYIKSMHRVDERLKDLMSDTISSMKSQISFLTPVIAGIVIGITSMISSILGTISTKLTDLGSSVGAGNPGGATALLEIFGQGGIPTYHFQAIVGIYVVQITYILTIMVNGVENGTDVLAEEDLLGKNLVRSTILYVLISGITILLFSTIAGTITQI